MKWNLLLAITILNLVIINSAVAIPDSCKSTDVSGYLHVGTTASAAPDKIYNFTKMRTDLFSSLAQGEASDCLSDFYRDALQEEGEYWGGKLARSGCQVSDAGEISGPCPQGSEARKSIGFIKSLDREVRGKVKVKIQQAEEVHAENLGQEIVKKEDCKCELPSAPKTPSVIETRDVLCCGTQTAYGGVIGAIEPGINYNTCIGKTRENNEGVASGVASCIGNVIASAFKQLWSALTSIFSIPGELWGARSQLWALMTQPTARAHFSSILMDQFKHFFTDRVGAFSCYNDYEKTQFVCKNVGDIIGICAAPESIGALLGLAAKPALAGARALEQILSKSAAGVKVLKGLDKTTEVAGKGISSVAKAARSGADKINDVTGGGAGEIATATGKGLKAVNDVRRAIGRPLSLPAAKIAAKIENSATFEKLFSASFKVERRAALIEQAEDRAQAQARILAREQARIQTQTQTETQTPTPEQPQAQAQLQTPASIQTQTQTTRPESVPPHSVAQQPAPQPPATQPLAPEPPPLSTTLRARLARQSQAAAQVELPPHPESRIQRQVPAVGDEPAMVTFVRPVEAPVPTVVPESEDLGGAGENSATTSAPSILHETQVQAPAQTNLPIHPESRAAALARPESLHERLHERPHARLPAGPQAPSPPDPLDVAEPQLPHVTRAQLRAYDREAFSEAEAHLLFLERGHPEEAARANALVIEKMNARPQVQRVAARASGLTQAKIEEVLLRVRANDVASQRVSANYDPEGERRLCFGRSIDAHLEAMRAGVDKDQIMKVWAVGPIGEDMQMHVSTFVRATDGQWMSLDTLLGEPLSLEKWTAHWARAQRAGVPQNLRIYATDASRFAVGSSLKYNRVDFGFPDKLTNAKDYYNGFFIDLMKTFKRQRAPNP